MLEARGMDLSIERAADIPEAVSSLLPPPHSRRVYQHRDLARGIWLSQLLACQHHCHCASRLVGPAAGNKPWSCKQSFPPHARHVLLITKLQKGLRVVCYSRKPYKLSCNNAVESLSKESAVHHFKESSFGASSAALTAEWRLANTLAVRCCYRVLKLRINGVCKIKVTDTLSSVWLRGRMGEEGLPQAAGGRREASGCPWSGSTGDTSHPTHWGFHCPDNNAAAHVGAEGFIPRTLHNFLPQSISCTCTRQATVKIDLTKIQYEIEMPSKGGKMSQIITMVSEEAWSWREDQLQIGCKRHECGNQGVLLIAFVLSLQGVMREDITLNSHKRQNRQAYEFILTLGSW